MPMSPVFSTMDFAPSMSFHLKSSASSSLCSNVNLTRTHRACSMNDFSSAGSAGTALIACERPNLWGRRSDGEGDVRSSEDWMPMTTASYAPMEPPSPQVSVQREGDQLTKERLRVGGSGANRQTVFLRAD